MTITELLEDLLTEFDELDMQPMLIVPNPLERAKAWKHELEYALKHLKAEVAREIFEEIDKKINNTRCKFRNHLDSTGVLYMSYTRSIIANLRKKYIGEQNDEK